MLSLLANKKKPEMHLQWHVVVSCFLGGGFRLFFVQSRLDLKNVSTEPQFYRLEGVWLTESGMSLLRSISMSPLHKRRQRRSRLGTLCCDGGPDGMDMREVEGDGDDGKGRPGFTTSDS